MAPLRAVPDAGTSTDIRSHTQTMQARRTGVNRQWRIASRPVGPVRTTDFSWHEEEIPTPGPGQMLIRNDHLSIDPLCRAWMWGEETSLPSLPLGSVVRGFALGTVVQSRHSMFREGTRIAGLLGWQDYAISSGAPESVIDFGVRDDLSPGICLGLLGHVGLAAYFGLIEIGRPTPGETLLVSSAAGAVGSLAGQIGKILGCKVVGTAGTPEKCRWLREELGFDVAICHRTESVFRRLKQLVPEGVDIYFDNVGGAMLEDAVSVLRRGARIVACGMLSQYNDVGGILTLPSGPNNLLNLTYRNARIVAFDSLDYWSRASEAAFALQQWHGEGRLKFHTEMLHGLEQAPAALIRLFAGQGRGKMIVSTGLEP